MAMIRYNVFAMSRRRLIVLLSSTAVFGIAIWVLNNMLPYRNIWQNFPAESDIGTYFCEKTLMDKIVRQPINTFSNIVYWISGFAIIRRGWKDQANRKSYNLISANPFYSITFGVILIYTFFASTVFHSSLINFTSRLDFSAVYSLALFPLMYYTHRVWLLSIGVPSNKRHTFSTRTVIIVFTLLYIILTFFIPRGYDDYVVLAIIIMLIILGTGVEMRYPGRTNRYYLAASSVSILIAVMWFAFDVHKVFCDPDSFIQPHSLWHLFAGTSTFYFYMYIRSEHNKI